MTRPPLGEIKTLLVDLDGTLLGARDLPLATDFVLKSVKAIHQYGGIRKSLRALSAVRQALESKPHALEPKTNAKKAVEAFAGVLNMGLEQAENVIVHSVRAIFPTLSHHFFPMPGARDFLNWAKGHYPLILATNPVWPRDIVELRLEWAGINPAIFKRITLAREMSASKSWLEYYRELLKQENLKPEECLLIGNDLKKDLSAVRVGINVFIVAPSKKIVKELRFKGALAPAWQGTFEHLKRLLAGE